MSRPTSRGRLKADAVVLLRLISSPSTRKDNSVLPGMNPGSQIFPGTRVSTVPRSMHASPHGFADAKSRPEKIRTSNIEHSTPNFEQKSGVASSRGARASAPCAAFLSSVRRWMFGVQCSMFVFPAGRAQPSPTPPGIPQPAGNPPPRSTDRLGSPRIASGLSPNLSPKLSITRLVFHDSEQKPNPSEFNHDRSSTSAHS